MTWADENQTPDEWRRARGERPAPADEAALADIAATPVRQPIVLTETDVPAFTNAAIEHPGYQQSDAGVDWTPPPDPSSRDATAAADVAYDAQQAPPPVAPAQSPVAPVPPASPPVAAPPTGAAGVSPVARSMQTLNRASGLDAPAAPGSRANAAPMVRQNTDLAQVGGEKAPDPEAALASARDADKRGRIINAMARLAAASVASPGVVISPLDHSRDSANEEAALGAAGRRTADSRFAAQQQAQRGAQQRTATNDAQAQSDRDRALSLQERGVAVQEGRAASQGTEETQRTTAAFEGLRQMNAQLPEGQRWTDEQMRTIAANPQVSAQVFGAQRGMQGQGATAAGQGAAREQQATISQRDFDERVREFNARHPAATGAGHGGGGTGDLSAAVADAAAHGVRISESDARRLGARGIRAVLQQAIGREGTSSLIEQRAENRVAIHQSNEIQDMERANEILPGVHATIQMAGGEPAKLRAGYDSGRNAIGAFERLRGISHEYGPATLISPEAAARVRAELIPLRHMVADIQGTGIINPSEVPVINAALSDPTSLSTVTFGTLNGAIDEWRQLSERGVRSTLANRGVNEAEQQVAIDQLFGGMTVGGARGHSTHRAAAAPLATSPAAATIRVRMPDGSVHQGPASARAQIEAAGGVVLP